jgi:leader peptidase (prepilin peptidase)/N-methyltransferase
MDLFLVITGLCIGSFLGALTYRYPRNVSITKGRSWCDKCKKTISWYDNLPLISYLLLRGKCRGCGTRISIRYPIIELTTAVMFYLIGFNLPALILFLILEAIFIMDLEHQIIPDDFVFAGIIISSLIILMNGKPPFSAFFAGFTAASFLALIFLLTKGKGMGLGDVKFAVLGGIIVGSKLTAIWLFTSFLTGAIVGIILIMLKSARLKDKIAFGPFLIAAIPITLIWGDKLFKLIF